MPRFTPLYDWIAQKKELSLLEKMIICRVLRFGDKGCFESNRSMARNLGVNHSNITRAIKRLIKKDWLMTLPETKYKRLLYVVPDRLKAGPLFGGSAKHRTGALRTRSGSAKHHVVKNLSYNYKRKMKEKINSLAELMKDDVDMTPYEFNQRRKYLLKQLRES